MGQATFAVKRDQLQVVMERVFDAPRETVFKAFVDPAAIPKWWGPRRLHGDRSAEAPLLNLQLRRHPRRP